MILFKDDVEGFQERKVRVGRDHQNAENSVRGIDIDVNLKYLKQ